MTKPILVIQIMPIVKVSQPLELTSVRKAGIEKTIPESKFGELWTSARQKN